MDKSVIIVAALVTADAVVNIACCLLGKKQAKVDNDLTEALLANRDAVMKRNELLEVKVEYLKTLIEMVAKKQEKERREQKHGKEEGESNL